MIATVYIPLRLMLALLVVIVATLAWFALLVAVVTLVRGSSWVWSRTRERLRRRAVVGRPLPPSPDQPIALTPRTEDR